MSLPVAVLAVHDPQLRERLEHDLRRRYAEELGFRSVGTAEEALETLRQLGAEGDEVALVLAHHRLPGLGGLEALGQVPAFFPAAKRVLLTDYRDNASQDQILDALRSGGVDALVGVPWPTEDRLFQETDDLLADWRSIHAPPAPMLRIVGRRSVARTHELKDLAARNGVAFDAFDLDTSDDGRKILQAAGLAADRLPIVLLSDGRALIDPSNLEIGEALGAKTRPDPIVYDLGIIGAGPAGLASAVYGASEGLNTVLLEQEAAGGQAGTSSRIENYLGFPTGVSGGALAQRALVQAMRFGVTMVIPQVAGRFRAMGTTKVFELGDGSELACSSAVIAIGITYHRLEAPGIERLTGAGVYYGAAIAEAHSVRGKEIFIVGAGNSAGQAAIHLAGHASRVTILVRGEALAGGMSDYLVRQIESTANVAVLVRTEIAEARGSGSLEALTLLHADTGERETVQAAALFIFIGAVPDTEWLGPSILRDERGFVLTGMDLTEDPRFPAAWPLDRDPFLLETSVPGVFAAGDVRHRSIKRVASAVGEGSIAVQFIHEYLRSVSQREEG